MDKIKSSKKHDDNDDINLYKNSGKVEQWTTIHLQTKLSKTNIQTHTPVKGDNFDFVLVR